MSRGVICSQEPAPSGPGTLSSVSLGVAAFPQAQPQQCRGSRRQLTPPQPLWAPVQVRGDEAEMKQRIVRILTRDRPDGTC